MRSSMEPVLYRFLPHRCRFFLTMKLSKFSSFRAIKALIASQLTFEKWSIADSTEMTTLTLGQGKQCH